MNQVTRLMGPILAILTVSALAGCSTLSPASVEGLRRAAGDSLPGARGQTSADQIKIDRTVARLCAAEVFVTQKCAEHTDASAARFQELRIEADPLT